VNNYALPLTSPLRVPARTTVQSGGLAGKQRGRLTVKFMARRGLEKLESKL
jgi:hypothetical protein